MSLHYPFAPRRVGSSPAQDDYPITLHEAAIPGHTNMFSINLNIGDVHSRSTSLFAIHPTLDFPVVAGLQFYTLFLQLFRQDLRPDHNR